jgi:hypothetical protein
MEMGDRPRRSGRHFHKYGEACRAGEVRRSTGAGRADMDEALIGDFSLVGRAAVVDPSGIDAPSCLPLPSIPSQTRRR